ncbi:MAG: PorT family protein [Flavobacterium sp.]|nr:MAG: PorT family protein [Flavobacterium sp.]
MKKILTTTLLCAIGMFSFAQTKIGIKAGVTLPTMSSHSTAEIFDGPPEYNFKSNTSFYIGGTIDFPISKSFAIQPGLTLTGKGGKTEIFESNFEPNNLITFQGTYKLSTMYLEVPVNAVFNFDLGTGKIFFGAGPYYAIAISGEAKRSGIARFGSITTISSKQDLEFGSNKDYKRGDFGLNFLAGYQLKSGFNIHTGYGLGLTSIDTDGFDETSLKNRLFSVGLGFSF